MRGPEISAYIQRFGRIVQVTELNDASIFIVSWTFYNCEERKKRRNKTISTRFQKAVYLNTSEDGEEGQKNVLFKDTLIWTVFNSNQFSTTGISKVMVCIVLSTDTADKRYLAVI